MDMLGIYIYSINMYVPWISPTFGRTCWGHIPCMDGMEDSSFFLCTKRLFASELRVPGTPNNMGYSNYGRRISAENSAFFDDHLMD